MKNKFLKTMVGALVATVAGNTVANAQAKGIEWDGFGSAYYGQAMGDVIPTTFNGSRDATFSNASLLGLNLHSKMDEHFSATGQLLALGSESYDLKVQWAYVTYAPSSDFNIQMGRLLYPVWLAAEYLNVGYLLPYRAAPLAVFATAPFSAYDGITFNKAFSTGAGKLTLGFNFGTPPEINSTTNGVTINAKSTNFVGLTATLEGDGWTGKVGVTKSNTALTLSAVPGLTLKSSPELYLLAFKYDRNNIVFWSEYLMVQGKDSSAGLNGDDFLEKANAGYALIGYRIGKWMPRYMYTTVSQNFGFANTNPTVDSGTTNESETHVLGVNYEVGAQSVLKVEYEMLKIKKGQGVATVANAAGDDTGGVVYAGVDFTF